MLKRAIGIILPQPALNAAYFGAKPWEPLRSSGSHGSHGIFAFSALQKNLWVIQWGSPTRFDDGVIWMTLPMMNPARGIFSGIDSCVQ